VGVLLGYENGTFSIQTTFSTGSNSPPISTDTGDCDNDSHLDIVVVNFGRYNVVILLGYVNGDFTVTTKHSTGNNSSPRSITVSDFDNDNRVDIAIMELLQIK
jgi:hypothetical protein